jgi:hypothetical protein
MNRGQLRAEVALRLRIPPAGDPLLDEPTLNDMIRAALIDVSSVSDWPWLLTSTSLTFTAGVAAIPQNATKVRDLIVNSRPAEYVGNAEFFLCQSVASRFVWTVLGTNIQLTPAPTVSPTNTLWYIQPEPSLTSDIMGPLVPQAHQQVLIARACYHAEVRRGRAEAASFHNAEYERGAERMKEATHTRTGPRQIRTASVGWYASW